VLVCPSCDTQLPVGAKFCLECGAQVTISPAEPQEPAVGIPDRIQRLVPKEYAERLLATRGQVQAERRMVTILFSDVKGSTAMAEHHDPEDVMEIMDGAFDVLIEPIYRYEGTLARLMGDAVLAFFGAPIAHEDDPERAIRAALEITAEAAKYAERLERERGIEGFGVRVGINTGLVVVGEVGSDLRVEYTAMGDAINLAARMEQNAPPGGILITHDTYRHVRGVFDVLRQEPLTVKGKREPALTYRVQRAKPRAFRKPMRGVEGIETRMIGRQAELSSTCGRSCCRSSSTTSRAALCRRCKACPTRWSVTCLPSASRSRTATRCTWCERSGSRESAQPWAKWTTPRCAPTSSGTCWALSLGLAPIWPQSWMTPKNSATVP
jgi:class 3 adenylate cyclase